MFSSYLSNITMWKLISIVKTTQEFPQKYSGDMWATGKLLYNAHDAHHLLAGFLFTERHIFMQTPARLRE
jgi:hypothetical protein